MATGTITLTSAIAGVSIGAHVSRIANLQTAYEGDALPAGKAGTLSTRTDDDTGVATLGAGHGMTDSDYVDVFWTGGCRYGMDVTSVDGNDVSINLGAGDVLPAQSTALIVTKQVTIDIDFDGDNVEMIAISNSKRIHLDFQENGGTSIKALDIPANEGWYWAADQGVSNPLTGNPVGQIKATSGETSAATLKIGVLYNSS